MSEGLAHWTGIVIGILMEAVITFINNTGKTSVNVMVRAQYCHHIGLKEKWKRSSLFPVNNMFS